MSGQQVSHWDCSGGIPVGARGPECVTPDPGERHVPRHCWLECSQANQPRAARGPQLTVTENTPRARVHTDDTSPRIQVGQGHCWPHRLSVLEAPKCPAQPSLKDQM